jgi:outer membrane immunogenic protein
MKRVILTALAGALACAIAAPGQAADLPRKALPISPVVAAFSWSGFYVGINGGYGWGKADLSNVVGSAAITTRGALFGATAGYNLQTGSWVWGIEGDIDYSSVRGSDATSLICLLGCEAKNTWLGTARGRLGYAFDHWMTYFTGGLAFGDVKVSAGTASLTKTQTGWTLGGGAEWAWSGPWSAKFEYLYVDLGSATCDAATCGVATTAKWKENILRAGLNYRF